MPGEGHFFAMLSRMKENRKLLNSKKEKLKANQSLYSYDSQEEQLNFKIVAEDELALIKQKNLNKIRNSEIKQFLLFIGISLLILLLIYGLNYFII